MRLLTFDSRTSSFRTAGRAPVVVWAYAGSSPRCLLSGAANFALDETVDGPISGTLRLLLTIFEQVLEELAVIDHRLAKVFRGCGVPPMPLGDVAGGAI